MSERNDLLYIISRTVFEIFIKVMFRLRIFGKENFPEAPFLIASNHASLVDPPLVGIACKKYIVDFMAKKELFDSPRVGAWTRAVGCIEVRRGENSIKGLKEAIRRLNKGRHVVAIFPEGSRSKDGELREAQRGMGFLVARAAVPVVPVYVEGSGEALPVGKRFKFNAPVNVYVGRPLLPEEFAPFKGTGKWDYEGIAGAVMDRIASLKARKEKGELNC